MLNSFVTPGTVAHQGPLFIELHGQEYWGGLPFLPPGDLPGPGIEPMSPALQVDSLLAEPLGKPFLCYSLPNLNRLKQQMFIITHNV